ncbi:type VI immunity family protein [Pseudomonas fluorescens]|uniref:type VI immunity family protein n=1 Tax=Pseudomonas fluorescens TaxID=294 RepID=UPI003F986101
MNEEQFFNDFDVNRWDFTIIDEQDEDHPVLQIGLVATFYLVDGYLPFRRQHIAEAFELYCKHFGEKLVWGYTGGEEMIEKSFSEHAMLDCIAYIKSDGYDEPAAIMWSSLTGFEHVGSYMFEVYSPAGWYENVHGSMTTVRLYLPVDELKGARKQHFESLIFSLCNILRPLHGAAGLGIQHSYEWENYQHVEYELIQEYRGVDLCIPSGNKKWRTGYTNLNWYTYLAHHWVSKLGTTEDLLTQLDDVRIGVLPYEWGTIFRAGNWPALGKATIDPRPELYVMVNEVLKPLRVNNIGSLHYGSIAGEIRLNERTSNQWMRRFDLPKGSPKPKPSPFFRRISVEEQQRLDASKQMFDAFLNRNSGDKSNS